MKWFIVGLVVGLIVMGLYMRSKCKDCKIIGRIWTGGMKLD